MGFSDGDAPGIYTDVPAHVYHAGKEMSHSRLKPLLKDKTPKQFAYALRHPIVPTTDMLMGTATHTLLMEPEKFDDLVETAPGETRRNKAWKARQAEVPHKILLSAKEMLWVEGMAQSVREEPELMKLLSFPGNIFEASLRWHHTADNGEVIVCKARPDIRIPTVSGIADLKTTDSVDQWLFSKKMDDLNYHTQAAMYAEGFRALGEKVDGALIIAIEREPPHICDLIEIGQESLIRGWNQVKGALNTVATCRRANSFPGKTIDLSNIRKEDIPFYRFGS